MSGQHRATPEQWEVVEICSEEGKIPWPTAACLLELRARIEAMEAAQQIRVFSAEEVAPIVVPASVARPAGGLVERVATIITLAKTSRGAAEDVLSEVAATARGLRFTTAKALIDWLDREADRG
jgi:hypothetical protein